MGFFFCKNVVWRLGDGTSVNFWRDCWIPRSFPLIDSYAEAIPESKMEKKVSDYVGINGNWLVNSLRVMHLSSL